MSRKGNCIDDGATEQVFGHLQDEFFKGAEWPSFDEFKRDLDAYIVHWNTRRRQVQTEGTDPGGVPESVPIRGLGRLLARPRTKMKFTKAKGPS